MTKWEYRYFTLSSERIMTVLDQIGREGWEAFSLENYIAYKDEEMTRIYCKRPLEPQS